MREEFFGGIHCIKQRATAYYVGYRRSLPASKKEVTFSKSWSLLRPFVEEEMVTFYLLTFVINGFYISLSEMTEEKERSYSYHHPTTTIRRLGRGLNQTIEEDTCMVLGVGQESLWYATSCKTINGKRITLRKFNYYYASIYDEYNHEKYSGSDSHNQRVLIWFLDYQKEMAIFDQLSFTLDCLERHLLRSLCHQEMYPLVGGRGYDSIYISLAGIDSEIKGGKN
ncbi:162_t:CDS:2 [Funneliformis mosseae]|uniref:162_t:CDS:1 n=1 Tax=Funneliformis mosseae TaxID=27381 RepID=A0A9N8VEI2_FUNMO|nr:162_t:CDS:2 [Funneliformis mosseae]